MHSVIWKIGRALELLYEAGAACSASVRRCIKGGPVCMQKYTYVSLWTGLHKPKTSLKKYADSMNLFIYHTGMLL